MNKTKKVQLRCECIAAGYGSIKLLFDVDLNIKEREVVTLLGRNGMGKSTLIKTLIGALRPTAGKLWFDDEPLHRLRPDAIARRGVAIVPEGRLWFTNLTVGES